MTPSDIAEILQSAGARPLRPSTIAALARGFTLWLECGGDLHVCLGLNRGNLRQELRDAHLRTAAHRTVGHCAWAQAGALEAEIGALNAFGWPECDQSNLGPLRRALVAAKRFGEVPQSQRQIYRVLTADTAQAVDDSTFF